jgi:hypothetical protein
MHVRVRPSLTTPLESSMNLNNCNFGLDQATFPTKARAASFRKTCLVFINEKMTAWTQGGTFHVH